MWIKVKWKEVARIAVCSMIVAMSGCSLIPKEETVLKPPLVVPAKENYNLYMVKKGAIEKSLSGTGVFESVHIKNQEFKAAGKIVNIHVKMNDIVKKGDVLVQLDLEDMDITLKERERDVLQAQYMIVQAKLANDKQLEKIRVMELDIAQIKLEKVKKQLEGKMFVAEMDGIVTSVETMNVGDIVELGKPYVTIADPSQYRLSYTGKDPEEVKSVQLGMKAEVVLNDKTYEAKVVQTPSSAPSTENETLNEKYAKTLYLEMVTMPIEFPKLDTTIIVHITLAKKENVLVIPKQGVNNYLGRDFVKILDGESVQELDVEKGLESSSEVEIIKGLKEGQQLILP